MSRVEKLQEYKAKRKNPKGPAKRLYTVPEAACYLGRTVDGLREMLYAGKLPYIKDGRRVLLDVKDMDEYVERNKTRFSY
ncbi:MAG: helix-turn-helix domain-containing protein [Syntrophorhabdales bacterium]|jgi:excisionase family DNA binding protein